jgi:NADPH:quinone reductase-like Zn-dependent oxidoreductase
VLAAGVTTLDGIDGLRLLDVEARAPGPDELTIAVRAAGVGPWEALVASGYWDVGRAAPLVLGVEGAGVVERVGDGVTGFAVGDRVVTHCVPFRDQGTWTERTTTAAALVAPLPDGLDFERAAALPVSGLTALQAIDWLAVGDGDLVLVTAASGGTGTIAVELAALRGATVIATAAVAGHDRLLRLGASAVVDSRAADWPARVLAAAGRPLDAALNGLPGPGAALHKGPGVSETVLGTLRDGGRLVTIVEDPPTAERGIAIRDLAIEADAAGLAQLAELAAAGEVTVEVDERFPLGEARAAFAALGGLRSGAKVVLVP